MACRRLAINRPTSIHPSLMLSRDRMSAAVHPQGKSDLTVEVLRRGGQAGNINSDNKQSHAAGPCNPCRSSLCLNGEVLSRKAGPAWKSMKDVVPVQRYLPEWSSALTSS